MSLWPDTASVDLSGGLSVGGCNVRKLCERFGTPLYLLDEATFGGACRSYVRALAAHYPGRAAAYFSGKSLLNRTVARWAHEEGLGIDVVSSGEMHVATEAGVPASMLHLHGNAKPPSELDYAIGAGVGAIVVDNLDELAAIDAIGVARDRDVHVLLRVAPDVGAETHPHIQTGLTHSKFGLLLDQVPRAIDLLRAARRTRLVGVHCHLGSQIFDLRAYAEGVAVLIDVRARLGRALGYLVDEVSPGGGLGVPYTATDQTTDIDTFVRVIANAMVEHCAKRETSLPKLILEPGRSISARAVVAAYSVVSRKEFGRSDLADPFNGYVHVDGGMADNLRPALYGAIYEASVATRMNAPRDTRVHLSGRYCESSDVLIHDVAMPAVVPGDTIVMPCCGAYTLSMSSNYNLTCRPALVRVGEGRAAIVQRRETFDDILRREVDVDADESAVA